MNRLQVKPMRAVAIVTAVCGLALLLIAAYAAQRDLPREALWEVVHGACVPGELQSHDPRPCTAVDLDGGVDKGYAVLKDLRGASQYLVIATAEVSGIESPALEAPGAPNYFADAWETRKYVDAALHKVLPRDEISLAINSAVSRSQDQLHIHVDCVREDVRASLLLHQAEIGTNWMPLRFPLFGHYYTAMWVPGENLTANPFKLLADGVPGAAKKMGDRTLVVVGAMRADGTPGFIILEDTAGSAKDDTGAGEELQDHACRVAAATPTSSN
jgi:CDP-diacylglycerol pyrophosphatase